MIASAPLKKISWPTLARNFITSEVSLFIPCFVDQIYPETGFNIGEAAAKGRLWSDI